MAAAVAVHGNPMSHPPTHMARLERFDNHTDAANDLVQRKKRLISRILLIFAVAILALITGTGLYSFRHPIHDAAVHVAATVRHGVSTHFADGVDSQAIVPFLKDIFSGQYRSAASPQEITAVGADTAAAFLYTVELTDGGRIEGKNISVDRETVTIADDSGVKIQVDRNRVVRITKMPL
ncbi:hypothetical protein JWG42_02605 [Desulfoprunum benzoelyticum]|uniref:Uncharacterized protein n=1 Tax=Desulfoprunum benzoelyticum TaxID=1506996 RepID=A0A840UQ52_9BACT|nr:hypothetical protein [Desulfoprunum benzoelyticum]MBB5346713.1 hypothetical protein [Desulfoprunum benzoelyticum]MBM9529045.1 hypothetical protein [Desulfoprunum benzoelyticum]